MLIHGLLHGVSFAGSFSPQNSSITNSALCENSDNQKEISTFQDREKAEKFMEDTRKIGLNVNLCRDITGKKGTVYKIFLLESKDIIADGSQAPVEHETYLLKKPEEQQSGQGHITDSIFEKKRRFFHPFLSLTSMYTDNIYNINRTKKSDFITIISPGIWLSIPHSQKKPILIDTSARFPGGFIVESLRQEFFRRFQAYLAYQTDIELFSRNRSENNNSHRIQGYIEYNMGSGISLSLQDKYLIAHDDRETGLSNTLDRYRSNVLNAAFIFDTGRKTELRAEYSNLTVSYDSSDNSFRNRMDNTFSGSLFYKLQPKTAILFQYSCINISYDKDDALNSKEHHFFTGVRWDITAKTKGIVKAGYGIKDFKSQSQKSNFLILEANIEHRFSSRTSLNLKAWRKTNETDTRAMNYIVSSGIDVNLSHKLAGRLTGSVNFSYINQRYKVNSITDTVTEDRDDNYFRTGFGIQYDFRKWLTAETGYLYSTRTSNQSLLDYKNNTFYIRLNSSL